MYLMIQNPGIAPVEAYTIFGVSSTNEASKNLGNDDSDLLIGKFGSGNKHAVNLSLRNNIHPMIFCGLLRLEFYVKNAICNDGLTKTNYGKVHCRMSGKTEGKTVKKDRDLSFALEYGIHDWTDISMALREFVSNSIDRTIREEGKFLPAIESGRLQVSIVEDAQVRAKDGYTRVFIPLTQEVQQFYNELGKRFLHFSEPELLREKILPKKFRNIEKLNTAVIYRKGVFVREVESDLPSIFDYNFDDELAIDECRNVDDYVVKSAAARLFRYAAPQHLEVVFKHFIQRNRYWEMEYLSNYDMNLDNVYNSELKQKCKENWNAAWKMASDDALICEEEMGGTVNLSADIAARKGYKVQSIRRCGWSMAAMSNVDKTVDTVLEKYEKEGIEYFEPTKFAQEAVDIVWEWIKECDLAFELEKPLCVGFSQLTNAESDRFGFYEDEIVYINQTHSNNGVNSRLLQTALDELTHHCTGSTDCSRDFQSFLMKLIITKFTKE